MPKITRRKLLISGVAVGGGLAIGFTLWPKSKPEILAGPDESVINAFLKISKSGEVIVLTPQAEMGQGIHTGLPMILAEELDADWSRVAFEEAPVHGDYANVYLMSGMITESSLPEVLHPVGLWAIEKMARMMNIQLTGGSTSVRNFYTPLRVAGAAARQMLIGAAAEEWGVPAGECATREGVVRHPASGRELAYGALAERAAAVTTPSRIILKDPKDFRIIGTSVPRLDTAAKVAGTAEFGIDVRLPGMLYGAIKASPAFGGRLTGHDAEAIRDMPGVVRVVTSESWVAVVGETYWQARQALDAMPVTFAAEETLSSADIAARFDGLMATGEAHVYEEQGDAAAVLAETPTGDVVEASYKVPYLAHACMEPMNATAFVGDEGCQIWAPTQAAALAGQLAAGYLGIEVEKVAVHTTFLGGGFGRRSENDFVLAAVAVSRAVGAPVQLIWSREEDVAQDRYRPATIATLRGALGGDGMPRAWHHRAVSQSVSGSYMGRNMPDMESHEPDPASAEGAAHAPYEIANRTVEHVVDQLPIPVGYWRSVGHTQNSFFTESFVDELAHKAGADPFAYRRRLLAGQPRYLAVLDKLEETAKKHLPAGPGAGLGVAIVESFESIVGQALFVTVTDGELKLDRLISVIDCGQAINPDQVVAQVEGAAVYGLTAALYGEITLADGAVEQSNFHDYTMMTLADSPEFETHIIESGAKLGGVGEPGTPPAAPALTNAIFDATGFRIRDLPVMNHDLAAA